VDGGSTNANLSDNCFATKAAGKNRNALREYSFTLTLIVGVTLGGGGEEGKCPHPQYFFNLEIFLVTELNNAK
jgi:hypothetical protein